MAYDDLKREPAKQRIDVLTIHWEKCGLEFGQLSSVGECTATGEPCFQGWATCRDKDNYVPVNFPVTFCTPMPNIPASLGALPFLDSVDHRPTEPDPEVGLGKRGSITIRFFDGPHDDVGIDPYVGQRAYNPILRGTFWTKMRARFPYYQQRLAEWWTGYMHDSFDLNNLIKRTYFVEDFDGFGSGSPEMVAKDPIKLADDDRSEYPPRSRGQLAEPLDAVTSYTALDIDTPDLDEYDLESWEPVGCVRIGNEVYRYTAVNKVARTTGVRLTGVSIGPPAPYTTVRESHSVGDLVQKCAYFFQMTPPEVYRVYLEDGAGVDSSYIPYSEWVDENTTWLAGLRLTRLVTEPEGVAKAINEVIGQAATWAIWFDDEAALIRYKVNRPLDIDEPALILNDDDNVVAGSVFAQDENDRLLNEVYLAFDQRDPTKKLDDVANYRTGSVVVRQPSQSSREYGLRKAKTIYARWSPAGNRAELENMAGRMLSNRATVPVKVEFQVERKDDAIALGDFIDLTTAALLDAFGGLRHDVRFRIIKASVRGATMSVQAREEIFSPEFGRWAPDELGPLDYADADGQQKQKYIFWADDGGMLGTDTGKAWL
jgi:hypothetical protein